MLSRIQEEQKEKQNQIQRLEEIKQLTENVCGPIKSGKYVNY